MNLDPVLANWTYETVLELIRHHDFEPGTFDFKEVLVPSAKQPMKSQDTHVLAIRKTACSMANSAGGFILFGVQDRANAHAGATPEERLLGIPDGDLRRLFGDLAQQIRPNIQFDCSPRLIPLPGTRKCGIFVVSIPKSPVRPHELGGIFYKRTEGGQAIAMDVGEVREQMLNTEERLRKLELLRTELSFIKQTHDDLRKAYDENLHVQRFDVSGIKPLMVETCSLFPSDKRFEEALTSLALAANHANGLMDKLNQHAFHGLSHQQTASDWRTRLHQRLDEIEKLCKTCGPMIFSVLQVTRGPMTVQSQSPSPG